MFFIRKNIKQLSNYKGKNSSYFKNNFTEALLSFAPLAISNVTSNLMNKLKTMKKRKSVTLSKLIKLKRLEKQIKLESEKDLAENEKSVFEGRTFSKI